MAPVVPPLAWSSSSKTKDETIRLTDAGASPESLATKPLMHEEHGLCTALLSREAIGIVVRLPGYVVGLHHVLTAKKRESLVQSQVLGLVSSNQIRHPPTSPSNSVSALNMALALPLRSTASLSATRWEPVKSVIFASPPLHGLSRHATRLGAQHERC